VIPDKTEFAKDASEATLFIENGLQAGVRYPLSNKPIIIGRDPKADICLSDDTKCSRQHAQVFWLSPQFAVEDLDSTNGTFVNDIRITGVTILNPNDKISIGKTNLLFQIIKTQTTAPTEQIPDVPKLVVVLDPEVELVSDPNIVLSRLVLTEASETNQRLGHENLGFLSEEHGFMPTAPPLLDLPPMYKVWDEIAERMPELYRTLSLRSTFDSLPILKVTEADLPDKYLLRASALLSIFGYAYYRIQPEPPDKIPDSIMQPWQEITRRLNRHGPVLSYIDLIIYNWKLINPLRDDPIQVENMELLVPTVDNVVERIFYLGQVEILSRLTPTVGAIVRAQEAVHNDDVEALKQELNIITEALQKTTYESLMKIKLNPYSGPYYVDTVIWAKTVGPLAVSIEEGVPGPSGIASPIFHLLDEFFGRGSYSTRLGEEMTHIREWYPPHWQKFLLAVAQISVADYVANSRDKILKGIFQNATQAYVAETGFLGRHRLKAYGFLETAFKVGRSVTIGSFSGKFEDRAWDQVHTQLNSSRLERDDSFPKFFHHAKVEEVNTLTADGANWVKQIVLNVKGTGIRYQAGDRCAILPENSDALVEKMLKVLRARGNEPVHLNLAWQQAVNHRKGYEKSTTLPLRTLLTFGHIRPIDRSIAKTLYVITHNQKIKRIVEARAEDQWELWDLLGLVTETGFDTRRFWKAHRGEQESICRIVPPESFRTYSISSVMEHSTTEGATQLHLTISRLRYETKESVVSVNSERFGTASNYLTDTSAIPAEDMGPVSFQIVHPPRFSMPTDPGTPIVMFAGGTGFAPFRSFILERAQQADPGESWLFLGTRTKEDIYYRDELERIVAQGKLNVRVAFSREETYLKFTTDGDGQKFVFEPGTRQYIGDEILKEENAQALWNLLRRKEDGGQGAYFYVCGRTRFANAVMDGIKTIIHRFADGSEEEKAQTARDELYRLVGEERYLQEIFTTYTGSHIEARKSYDASEVALHNDEEHGYWMIVDGRVYDLTEFAHLHPGGFKIIREYTGMDATQAYQKILHQSNPEIDSLLGMYEIGLVRRLNFGMGWGVLIGPKGLESITLASTYRIWMRYLYFVVELENSLHNEFTIQEQSTTRHELPNALSPYKAQLLLQIYKRFTKEYIGSVMGEPLKNLWAVTSGLCAPSEDVRKISNTLQIIEQSENARRIGQLGDRLTTMLETIVQHGPGANNALLNEMGSYFDILETAGKSFMRDLRMAILVGICLFEELEGNTLALGSERLFEAVQSIPNVLDTYYTNLFAQINILERQDGE
jgi:sulfite reductase (NADPH) flavoprotein alpha-component